MAIGSWMLIGQARGQAPDRTWGVLHAHVLLMGFMLMLIIGVAFWMFPRVNGQRPGREGGWVAFAAINAGLLLRLVSEHAARTAGSPWRIVLGVAAVLPLLGALAFAVSIWPRVRAAMTPEEARRLRARRDAAP